MSNVTALPGVRLETMAGAPRPDIAQMLRELADRADAGEFDAMVLAYSMSDGGTGQLVCTPENALTVILGLLEQIKFDCWDRRATPALHKGLDP